MEVPKVEACFASAIYVVPCQLPTYYTAIAKGLNPDKPRRLVKVVKLEEQGMILGIFEDELYENLLPIAYTRPVYELRAGVFTLRERVERVIREAGIESDCTALFMRDYLAQPSGRS